MAYDQHNGIFVQKIAKNDNVIERKHFLLKIIIKKLSLYAYTWIII